MREPSLFARIFEFVIALWSNWIAWVSGVVLVMEPLLELGMPKSILQRIDQKFPKEQRRKYLLCLAAFGFIVASFQAYDDVSQRLRSKTNEHDAYKILLRHRWEPLTEIEQAKVEIALRALPAQHSTIICNSADCADLAYSFANVFDRLHWKAYVETSIGGTRNPIEIESANPLSQKVIDQIAIATDGRIRMVLNPHVASGHPDVDNDLEIVIGRKP